jgi:putative ABC transport system permease protein
VLMSVWSMRWFVRALEVNEPPFWIRFDLDFRVMLFVLALIVVASLLAGVLPALQSARAGAAGALKDDTRSATSARLGRFSHALVVVELALSCGLLIAAGLMITSVVQLKTVDMPFAVDSVLTARLDLPRSRYPDSAAAIRFYAQLQPALEVLPGVAAATMSDGLPAAGNGLVPLQIEGRSYPHESDYPQLREGIVTAGYFATFQTPVLGREFTPADTASGRPVAIINESFARTHYPDVNPLGRTFKRIRPSSEEPWLTVVGVVPDLMMQGIGNNNASPDGYYIPIAQSDVANAVRIALRATGDPAAAAPALRSAVAALDPDLAVYDVRPLRAVIEQQTWFYTVFGTFFMAFGVCALFLAGAGLYGVMSFVVTQRTREMGVRSALGARGSQLIYLVLRRSLIQLAIGLALGLGLALLVSDALQPVLYKVDPRDPRVFASVVALLTAAALLASYLPARRAAAVDPAIALTIE